MTLDSEEVSPPSSLPDCTPEQILIGEKIDPMDRLKIYSADKFEEFIAEWAYFYLKKLKDEYLKVIRIGGSGDKGRDVIGYTNDSNPPETDIYQCKHYSSSLAPNDLYPEIAKLCVHTFEKTISVPRTYYIVAPQDVGPSLAVLLENTDELKSKFVTRWKSKPDLFGSTTLDGKLETYVNSFDFTKIRHKPIQEVIDEHSQTIRHAPRFGGGLNKHLPDPGPLPDLPTKHETRFVEELVDVYKTDSNNPTISVKTLLAELKGEPFGRHFKRSRERFYYAESLREFAKDNLPESFSYNQIQDDVFDGIADTLEMTYPDRMTRLRATTDSAATVNVGNHPLKPYVKTQSLRGICHQLVNDGKLSWNS